jgi:hypothetical protein
VQLTNADRRVLLDSFRTMAAEWAGKDADLIVWATGWAASLAPTFGFESSLTRDVFVLCETLRRPADGEATRLARGGLAYLYQNNHVDPLPLGPLGLLDDAFVVGYAAHAVREKSGEVPGYCPPGSAMRNRHTGSDKTQVWHGICALTREPFLVGGSCHGECPTTGCVL